MNFIRQGIGVTRIVIADIPYILSGGFLKEKSPFGTISGLLVCFSDFGSILPFLDYWKAIDLSHIAGVIGRVRFLSPLMQVPIGTVLSVVSTIGYIFFGLDAVYRLFQPQTKGPYKRQAWLDIANAVVQITLSGLLIAGMSRLPVLIPMGGVCLVVGSICFLHRCTLPPEPGTEKKKNKNKIDPEMMKNPKLPKFSQTLLESIEYRKNSYHRRSAMEVMS